MKQNIQTIAGWVWKQLTTSRGTPRRIALGFSLGVIIGMTPFLGIHIVSCVLLASLFGWSKIAATVGVNITNVVTAPLIYPVNYWVGLRLAGISDEVKWSMVTSYADMLNLMKQSPLILADLFIGGIILGMPLSIIAYFSVLKIVHLYRK